MHRHADRARLVGERACDGLADPPRRVRRELVAAAPVELLDGADETERPFLDQVEERQTLVAVVLRDRDDEAEVRLDHPLLREHVAALDLLRELDLLRGGQERVLAGLAEEELERVGRRLDGRRRGRRGRCGLLFLGLDEQLDAAPVELLVDGLDLQRVELERFEQLVQFDLAKLSVSFCSLEQRRKFLVDEDRLDLDRQVAPPDRRFVGLDYPFPAPSHNPNTSGPRKASRRGAHGKDCYVKPANGAVTSAPFPRDGGTRVAGRDHGYPQVAQSTVEMLIIQNPQSADFSCRIHLHMSLAAGRLPLAPSAQRE